MAELAGSNQGPEEADQEYVSLCISNTMLFHDSHFQNNNTIHVPIAQLMYYWDKQTKTLNAA